MEAVPPFLCLLRFIWSYGGIRVEAPSGRGVSEFGRVRGRIYSSLKVLATALECIFRVFRLNLRLKLRETPVSEPSLRMDI